MEGLVWNRRDKCLRFSKEIPLPSILSADDIKIRVIAACISAADLRLSCGEYEVFTSDHSRDEAVIGFEVCGIVEEVGETVERFRCGDTVVGITPVDRDGGCAQYMVSAHYFFVPIPVGVSAVDAVSVIGSGVFALNALHYGKRLVAGESMLLTGGATLEARVICELGLQRGISTIVIVNDDAQEEEVMRSPAYKGVGRIINCGNERAAQVVMKETERIGVDLIVECDAYSCPSLSCSSDSKSVRSNEQNVGTQTNTVHELPPEDRAYVEEDDRVTYMIERSKQTPSVSNAAIMSCLALHGTWICRRPIQLEPPEAQYLLLKSASIAFNNGQTHALGVSQQGRCLHMMKKVVELLKNGRISPLPTDCFLPIERGPDAFTLFSSSSSSSSSSYSMSTSMPEAALYGRIVVKLS